MSVSMLSPRDIAPGVSQADSEDNTLTPVERNTLTVPVRLKLICGPIYLFK